MFKIEDGQIWSVIFGLHNFCNRSCQFCIIPKLGRNNISCKTNMTEDMFHKTLDLIKNNIKYFKQPLEVRLFNFNEPFSDPELFSKYAKIIKEEIDNKGIGKTQICLTSNGDYFTPNNFRDLCGYLKHVDDVWINDYEDSGMVGVLDKISKWSSSFELVEIVQQDMRYKKNKIIVKDKESDTFFHFFIDSTKDLKKHTRGSFLHEPEVPNWVNKEKIKRDFPCDMLGRQLIVDFNGSIMACTEGSCDIQMHIDDLKIGNILDGMTIEEIFERISKLDIKKLPSCEYCLMKTNYCF